MIINALNLEGKVYFSQDDLIKYFKNAADNNADFREIFNELVEVFGENIKIDYEQNAKI